MRVFHERRNIVSPAGVVGNRVDEATAAVSRMPAAEWSDITATQTMSSEANMVDWLRVAMTYMPTGRKMKESAMYCIYHRDPPLWYGRRPWIKNSVDEVAVGCSSDDIVLTRLQQLAIIAFQYRSARHYKSVDSIAELSKMQSCVVCSSNFGYMLA